MNAIIKNENVYVVVRSKDAVNCESLKSSENLIVYDDRYSPDKSLYGGRVCVVYYSSGDTGITVDGIMIRKFFISYGGEVVTDSKLSLEEIAAFLNQIENLGIDSFLENYKKQVQELKKEFEVMAENIQQELSVNQDKNKIKLLESLKKTLLSMTCLLFSLLINMNAGLTNQHYTNAYDTVVNMYF